MRLLDDLGLPRLAPDLRRVEEALEVAVRAPGDLLGQAAGHLLGAGGKRLRPSLTLCAAYAAGGADPAVADAAVTGAAAVELAHLGSLYHDDVIDEAETRRGVPSVNARWSNIVAILAGDYLLARASSLAASLGAEVAGLLAATIGELCAGQVLELEHLFDAGRGEDSYFTSIEGKTASLMATACRMGGMVCEVDDATLDALTQYGHHLGMCFQIVDDVLDVTRTGEQLGKPSGNDLHEGVYTLPVIHAAAASPELREMLGRKLDWPAVERARRLVLEADVVDSSLAAAQAHSVKAAEAIGGATALDPYMCERLAYFVSGLVTREN